MKQLLSVPILVLFEEYLVFTFLIFCLGFFVGVFVTLQMLSFVAIHQKLFHFMFLQANFISIVQYLLFKYQRALSNVEDQRGFKMKFDKKAVRFLSRKDLDFLSNFCFSKCPASMYIQVFLKGFLQNIEISPRAVK